jgi:hypothetical protein
LRRDTEALAAWLNALLSGEVARLSEHDVRALPFLRQARNVEDF